MIKVSNKIKDNKIKETFTRYIKYKIKLNHLNIVKHSLSHQELENMKDYVVYIEDFLNSLNKQQYQFLTDVYIKKLTAYDMYISKSNYYYKKRKYNDILYNYLF